MVPKELNSIQYAIVNLMETQYNITRTRKGASRNGQLAIDKQLKEINYHLVNLSVKHGPDYRIAYEAFMQNEWFRDLAASTR